MDRPTHPDFGKIAAILRKMDDDAARAYEEAGESVVIMAEDIDLTTLVYAAQQRSIRARKAVPDDDDPKTSTGRDALLWVDGFVAGQRYNQSQSNELVTEFANDLDAVMGVNKIDGNRRARRGKRR